MFIFCINMQAVADHLPWLGKRELVCLLSFTCNYVLSVWRVLLFFCYGLCLFIVAIPGHVSLQPHVYL